jgi:hypothetical protein
MKPTDNPFGLFAAILAVILTGCFATGSRGAETIISPTARTNFLQQLPIQVGKTQGNAPADQAYAALTAYQRAFNSHNKKAVLGCYVNPGNGKQMAEKATGEWWRRQANDPSIAADYRVQARQMLEIIRVKGLPTMPAGLPTIVIVAKDNKTATVIIPDFKDLQPNGASRSFTMIYQLRRVGPKQFKILAEDSDDARNAAEFRGMEALKQSVPGDRRYCRIFNAGQTAPGGKSPIPAGQKTSHALLPIVVGKTKQEVLTLLGTPDSVDKGSTWLGWYYKSKLPSGFQIDVHWYANEVESRTALTDTLNGARGKVYFKADKVETACASYLGAFGSIYLSPVYARQIVPQGLLDRKPDKIYWDTKKQNGWHESLLLSWHIDRHSYFVIVQSKQPLGTETKKMNLKTDKLEYDYKLTGTGRLWPTLPISYFEQYNRNLSDLEFLNKHHWIKGNVDFQQAHP